MQARAAARTETRTTPPRHRTRRDSLPPPRSSVTPGTAARRRWPGTREHRRPAHHTLIRRLAPALDCITAAAVPAHRAGPADQAGTHPSPGEQHRPGARDRADDAHDPAGAGQHPPAPARPPRGPPPARPVDPGPGRDGPALAPEAERAGDHAD